MHGRRCHVERVIVRMLACWLALLLASPNPTLAQSTGGTFDDDLEGPTIEHRLDEEPRHGQIQRFSARVADDRALESVTLHLRSGLDGKFVEWEMFATDGSSMYTVEIELEDNAGRVEYYIRAQDASGNAVVRGSRFSPLVREIAPTLDGQPRSKVVYSVLGGLGLALLIFLANSGDDPDETGCRDANGCNVDIFVLRP